jgi:hypothetical protein
MRGPGQMDLQSNNSSSTSSNVLKLAEQQHDSAAHQAAQRIAAHVSCKQPKDSKPMCKTRPRSAG